MIPIPPILPPLAPDTAPSSFAILPPLESVADPASEPHTHNPIHQQIMEQEHEQPPPPASLAEASLTGIPTPLSTRPPSPSPSSSLASAAPPPAVDAIGDTNNDNNSAGTSFPKPINASPSAVSSFSSARSSTRIATKSAIVKAAVAAHRGGFARKSVPKPHLKMAGIHMPSIPGNQPFPAPDPVDEYSLPVHSSSSPAAAGREKQHADKIHTSTSKNNASIKRPRSSISPPPSPTSSSSSPSSVAPRGRGRPSKHTEDKENSSSSLRAKRPTPAPAASPAPASSSSSRSFVGHRVSLSRAHADDDSDATEAQAHASGAAKRAKRASPSSVKNANRSSSNSVPPPPPPPPFDSSIFPSESSYNESSFRLTSDSDFNQLISYISRGDDFQASKDYSAAVLWHSKVVDFYQAVPSQAALSRLASTALLKSDQAAATAHVNAIVALVDSPTASVPLSNSAGLVWEAIRVDLDPRLRIHQHHKRCQAVSYKKAGKTRFHTVNCHLYRHHKCFKDEKLYIDALRGRAHSFMALHKYDKAADDLRLVTTYFPCIAGSFFELARAFESDRAYMHMAVNLQVALRLNIQDAERLDILVSLCDAFKSLGKMADFDDTARRLMGDMRRMARVKADPNCAGLVCEAEERIAQMRFREANSLLVNKRNQSQATQAIDKIDKALRSLQTADIFFARGLALAAEGRHSEAVEDFKEFLQRDESERKAAEPTASARRRRADGDDEAADADSSKEYCAYRAWIHLADSLIQLAREARAHEEAHAQELDDSAASTPVFRYYREASDYLASALAAVNSPHALLLSARVSHDRGDLEEADKLRTRAIGIIQGWNTHNLRRSSSSSHDSALLASERSPAVLESLLLERGLARKAAGRLEEAEGDLREARRLQEEQNKLEDNTAICALIECLAAQGRHQQAADLLDSVYCVSELPRRGKSINKWKKKKSLNERAEKIIEELRSLGTVTVADLPTELFIEGSDEAPEAAAAAPIEAPLVDSWPWDKEKCVQFLKSLELDTLASLMSYAPLDGRILLSLDWPLWDASLSSCGLRTAANQRALKEALATLRGKVEKLNKEKKKKT